MAQTKNLCAQIPTALHAQVCAAREQSGLTTAQYITNLLLEYYEMKENGGKTTMANNSRTMAFQIPETLFQRIKAHLERETQRTGRKLTQREFVLGLIEEALEAAERQAVEDIPEPEEEQPSEDAGVSPCEAQPEGGDTQPQEDGEPTVWGVVGVAGRAVLEDVAPAVVPGVVVLLPDLVDAPAGLLLRLHRENMADEGGTLFRELRLRGQGRHKVLCHFTTHPFGMNRPLNCSTA